MGIQETIDSTQIIDNHAHAVTPLPDDLTPEMFAGYFTEGAGTEQARHTIYYRRGLRLLEEYFDASSESELIAARADVDLESYSKTLMEKANISHVFQDTGTPPGIGPDDFAAYTDATIRPVLRIETEAEDIIDDDVGFKTFEERFLDRVQSALAGDHIALKSIVAYRTGLDVRNPSRAEAARAYVEVCERWDGRVEHPVFNDYLVNLAADVAAQYDAPFQFHTGFGDADAHPTGVDPGNLWKFMNERPETDIVLLHASYPYAQKAGYIVSVQENVYLDLGMTIPFIQHGVADLLRQVVELAPTTKLLYSSDGYVIPEWYYLASERIRTDLATVLTELVEDGPITEAYAEEIAVNILRDNARYVYGI